MMKTSRPRGWWYPWTFVGGMIVVIVVNVVLVYYALSTFPGLETEDYYNKGIAYNQNLAAARAQAARGWHMDLSVSTTVAAPSVAPAGTAAAAGAHHGHLALTFADRDKNPLEQLSVRVFLIRPTIKGFDQTIDLSPESPGRYVADFDVPLPGQWEAHIVAARGDAHFQESRRLSIP